MLNGVGNIIMHVLGIERKKSIAYFAEIPCRGRKTDDGE